MIQIARITIEKIQELRDKGYKQREIAEELGTTENYIKRVIYDSRHPEKLAAKNKKHNRVYNKREEGIEIPGTEIVISRNAEVMEQAVGKIGDDKVNAFINYHLDMLKMRQGVNKQNVPDLYKRFIGYLEYCAARNIVPNNMNAYFAIGISRQDVSLWYNGKMGTPEHRKFAEDIRAFFSSIHEQAGMEGLANPILTIWWQKSHDNMIEAQKLEQVDESPLGEKQSAEAIAAKWSEVELPDD